MLVSSKKIILDSIHLYRNHFKTLFLATLPLFFLSVAVILVSAVGTLFEWGGSIVNWSVVGINIVLFFLSLWFVTALMHVVAQAYKQYPDLSYRSSLAAVRVHFFPIILTVAITFLAIVGTTLMLIVPGIIFSVLLFFTLYSSVIDNISPKKIIRYNINLVWGNWWGTVWRLFIPFAVFTLPLFALDSVLNLILQNIVLSSSLSVIIWSSSAISIISSAINLVLAPIFIANTVILYESLKQQPK